MANVKDLLLIYRTFLWLFKMQEFNGIYSQLERVSEEEYCFDETHLRIAVTNKLGYRLDDKTWSAVNEAFGYYWDDVVGLGNEIEYGNMIETMIRVTNFLEVYMSYGEMQKIVDAILDYISNIPGALY